MLGIRRKSRPPHPDCLPVLLPLDLLGQRSKEIKTIQQLAGVPKAHWRTLYMEALLAFAGYVQQLPASEAHHHSGAGGLLDHTLEVVIQALRLRRGHLLPQGGRCRGDHRKEGSLELRYIQRRAAPRCG